MPISFSTLVPFLFLPIQRAFLFQLSAPPVVPEIDLVIAVNTFSSNADNVFQKIKETITSLIDTYGAKGIHFTIFAATSDDTIIYFENYTTSEQLKRMITSLDRQLGGFTLDEALRIARKVFKSSSARESAQKVFVLIADKKSTSSPTDVAHEVKALEDMDVTVIPVGIGGEVDIKELQELTPNISDVINTSVIDDVEKFREDIMLKILKGRTCLLVNSQKIVYQVWR